MNSFTLTSANSKKISHVLLWLDSSVTCGFHCPHIVNYRKRAEKYPEDLIEFAILLRYPLLTKNNAQLSITWWILESGRECSTNWSSWVRHSLSSPPTLKQEMLWPSSRVSFRLGRRLWVKEYNYIYPPFNSNLWFEKDIKDFTSNPGKSVRQRSDFKTFKFVLILFRQLVLTQLRTEFYRRRLIFIWIT